MQIYIKINSSVLKLSSGNCQGWTDEQTDGHTTIWKVSHKTLSLCVEGYKNSPLEKVLNQPLELTTLAHITLTPNQPVLIVSPKC